MSATNPYLEAAARIPAGETRTFAELAAMAGRPGAARAAGRAIAATRVDAPVPWHRVVAAGGGLARDPERARVQLERLRAEGARARAEETTSAWLARIGAPFAANLRRRLCAKASDARVDRWQPLEVEPVASEDAARARGFAPVDGTPRAASPRPPRRGDASATESIEARVDAIDWDTALATLRTVGYFHVPRLLAPAECADLVAPWDDAARFERTIEMGPKGYGIGTYRYWKDPLPDPAEELRARLYAHLRDEANRWRAADRYVYPPTLATFHAHCREAGQRRASSILLRYPTGGLNHPHRDLYGAHWFPFQALAVLSRRGEDFEGGAFVLIEGERRVEIAADEGDLVVFASAWRPDGRRRIELRHAMTPVFAGERYALGIVFNTAD